MARKYREVCAHLTSIPSCLKPILRNSSSSSTPFPLCWSAAKTNAAPHSASLSPLYQEASSRHLSSPSCSVATVKRGLSPTLVESGFFSNLWSELLFAGVRSSGMRHTHFEVEPPVHQFLQTRLTAKVLRRGVMRQHVFPGIDFEHVAFRRLGMGAEGLAPGEPPMVHTAFLLATDIAVKRFRPGQWRHPVIRLDFPHEGSLHQGRDATAIFCHFGEQVAKIYQISYPASGFRAFARLSTGVPQSFLGSFTRMQHWSDNMSTKTLWKIPFLGCISNFDGYHGCPKRFPARRSPSQERKQ